MSNNGIEDFRTADPLQDEKFGLPHLVGQARLQFVDDGSDLVARSDQQIVLRFDEHKERNNEKDPPTNRSPFRCRQIVRRIDRGQGSRVARAGDAGNDDQALQGALHFLPNKLEEMHR
ncbi:MAG TPA: hypothetical protein VGO49_18750 [Bradyrhizobium sp.]|jgi:hypothetical protein|nr:hypothetical protein [Bradyrhizobium sp.]